ncbi:MAG: hypothetical protein OXG36_02350 [Caldilineaceae bacterium]|nr:hypothetical protein [Caldilineaceae bacterium]
MALNFVPSKDGISHNEIESVTPEDLAAGCQILFDAAVHLTGPAHEGTAGERHAI